MVILVRVEERESEFLFLTGDDLLHQAWEDVNRRAVDDVDAIGKAGVGNVLARNSGMFGVDFNASDADGGTCRREPDG